MKSVSRLSNDLLDGRAEGVGYRLVDKSEAALTVFGENEIRVDVNHLPQERALFVDRFCYLRALCDVAKNARDKLSLLSRPRAKGKLHRKFSAAFFPTHHVYYFSDNVRFALGDETCHFPEGLVANSVGDQQC